MRNKFFLPRQIKSIRNYSCNYQTHLILLLLISIFNYSHQALSQGRCGIGNKWIEKESGWTATWNKTGECMGGSVFNAVWTHPTRPSVSWHNIQVYLQPNGVDLYVYRPGCWYEGRIQNDGITVRGQYGCSWNTGPMNWEATIVCDGMSSTPGSTGGTGDQWLVRVKDETYNYYYDYCWTMRPVGTGKFEVSQVLMDTNHGHHRKSIGQPAHNIQLSSMGNGIYNLYATGDDTNPNAAGYFEQKGSIRIQNGKLSGKGDHFGKNKVDLSYDGSSSPNCSTDNQANNSGSEIGGNWKVRVKDETYNYYYDYCWNIQPTGSGKYQATQILMDTNHGHHRKSIGQAGHTIQLASTGSGQFSVFATGDDTNPNAAGYFEQKGNITIQNGRLSGNADHQGKSIFVKISYNGERSNDCK